MKIQEVMDKIYGFHPSLGEREAETIDGLKIGDTGQECTGIATGIFASVEVIEQAHAAGANLLLVHEPVFYDHFDKEEAKTHNEVARKKAELCEKYHMVIIRDHDHLHAHRPDGIFTGVLRYLGWEEYAETDTSMGMFAHFIVTLPAEKETTLQKLLAALQDTIGMNGVRYVGPDDMPVKKLAIVGHLYPMQGPDPEMNHRGFPKEYSVEIIRYFEEQDVDVVLPGETIDWTLLSYVRDAVELGQQKAVVPLGHFNWEELGMRYAKEWVQALAGPELSVTYVPTGDMWKFLR